MIQNIGEQKNLTGKTVLLRADLDEAHNGQVLLDDFRIRMAVSTIRFLHQSGAKVVIVSKIGRPQGFDANESLYPAAARLADLLGIKLSVYGDRMPAEAEPSLIFFKGDLRSSQARDDIKRADRKDIILLENIRFYEEEEKLDQGFAKNLVELADIYVNDAFAMCHRNEVTISVLPKIMPKAYAGLQLQKEIIAMQKVLTYDVHPFLLIMGGVKISDKIQTIKNLGRSADKILIGGALANLFFLAKGYQIGQSKLEQDKLLLAQELLRNFKNKIILPEDVVVGQDFKNIRVCKSSEVRKEESVYDIGPKTILQFANEIKQAKKMIWNGPLGLIEKDPFASGSLSVAGIFAAKCQGQAYGLVGGGDTLELIDKAKVGDQIDFISTGGGAMLDYLAGMPLPGIEALDK